MHIPCELQSASLLNPTSLKKKNFFFLQSILSSITTDSETQTTVHAPFGAVVLSCSVSTC